MKNNNVWEQKVQQALDSLDGIQRAVSNPFLYTRIKERLEDRRNSWARIVNFLGKPAVAISTTAIFIAINAFVVLSQPPISNVGPSAAAVDPEMSFEPEYATVNYSLMDVNSNDK